MKIVKVGDKVKIVKDMPSVDGMLYKDTIVKIDEIKKDNTFRVVDSLGKIWWVGINDMTGEF